MNLPQDPYDLDSFFIKPTDERGHGDKINARVPPDLARLVDIIVSSKMFPYKTSSDFFRDAVWRLAGLLAPKIEYHEGTTIMAKLGAVEEILKVQEDGEKLLRVVDNLSQRLMVVDTIEEKRKLVGKVKKNFEQVKEVYWRDRCLRTLRERFGEYLG